MSGSSFMVLIQLRMIAFFKKAGIHISVPMFPTREANALAKRLRVVDVIYRSVLPGKIYLRPCIVKFFQIFCQKNKPGATSV